MMLVLEPRTRMAVHLMAARTCMMVLRKCGDATLRNDLRHSATKNIDMAMNIWRKENA